jgi:outer membrane receptor protein involved in Fe transport
MQKHSSRTSPLVLAVAAAVSSGVIAQEDRSSRILEEVTVYAQKREQSILEVPVSVASYGSEALNRAQIRDLTELSQVAPSVVFNSSTGATQSILTIRGIGTAGQNSGLEQSVGVFIDNVYRGRPGAALGDFVDLESIEVLRGPQGTLFGRNTSAGVISVRSKAPEQEFGGDISVGIGDFGYQQVRGSVTGPITDNLAWRLAGTWQERDGYIDDTFSGEQWNDRDRYTVRGQMLWDINETTSLRLIADYTETDERCCVPVQIFDASSALLLIGSPGGLGALSPLFANFNIGIPLQNGTPGTTVPQEVTFEGQFLNPDDYEGTRTSAAGADDSFEDGGVSAELNTALSDNVDMTLIGAYRFFETNPFGDIDMRTADIWRGGRGQDIDEISLEVRFSGTQGKADWTVGAFYFDQDIKATGNFEWGQHGAAYLSQVGLARLLTDPEVVGAGATAADILGSGLVDIGNAAPGGAANPLNWSPTAALAGTGAQENIDYNSKSYALFGQVTFNLTDRLSWTIGGRYTDEEKEASYITTSDDFFSQRDLRAASLSGNDGLFWALRPIQVHIPSNAASDTFEDDDLSLATNLNYELSDAVSVFARFAQGYKAGGLNLNGTIGQQPGNPTPTLANNEFDSETSDSFELGMKSFLLDRTLQLNATLFYQETQDFQTNSFDGVTFTLRNAGEIRGTGLELDYVWMPTDNWTVSGGVVWQDIEYEDFTNASSTIAQQEAAGLRARALGIVPDQDLTGETPNFVSDVTWSGSLAYRRPLADGLALSAATSWRYRSSFNTAQDNEILAEQDDFWTLNATIGIGADDDRWKLELWGKNLTDETVLNIGFDTPAQTGSFSGFIEPPRMLGGTVSYNF